MAKVLVLYYSSYGHVEELSKYVADGAKAEGAQVSVKRVPEIIPIEQANKLGFKLDQQAPFADPHELSDYDAIIVGNPTRFGRMTSQMAAFWDRTGELFSRGALIGKIGASFVASNTQHGGQETTHFSTLINMLHHGMIVTGLPYNFAKQMSVEQIIGGSPYGASTIAKASDHSKHDQIGFDGGYFLGSHVAKLAKKLSS